MALTFSRSQFPRDHLQCTVSSMSYYGRKNVSPHSLQLARLWYFRRFSSSLLMTLVSDGIEISLMRVFLLLLTTMSVLLAEQLPSISTPPFFGLFMLDGNIRYQYRLELL